uniref:VWFA domain-containing protein n=1 Tax=viral metagenome TaxID=1070528 RepID=A0A6C0HHI2_9ZZZZ
MNTPIEQTTIATTTTMTDTDTTTNTTTDTTIMSVLQFNPIDNTLVVPIFANDSTKSEGDQPQYQFGVLEISTTEKEALPYTWDVKFDVDCSGSMSDKCADGREKMHHIKHVLSNILRLFATYSHMRFNVSVEAFDDKLNPIFDFVQITSKNIESYIAKIHTIYPIGQTNLMLPLRQTRKQMADRAAEFPAHKRLHFLLTDGVDTCGNSSAKIVNTVEPQYDTIVFGFGIDHDSQTLMAIGEKPCCEYAFIAELEKAGIVYGEYIHNVLYRSVEEMRVLLENAEIYCWKTNTWNTSLTIGNIASGLKKTYYVRTTNPINTVQGEIHGCECTMDGVRTLAKLDDIAQLPYLVNSAGEIVAESLISFNEHALRLKTLELLHEVAHLDDENPTDAGDLSQSIFASSNWALPPRKPVKYYNNVKVAKEKLSELYRKIRDYKVATFGEETENTFLAALMDDLYVARRGLDHHNGRLYTMSRQRTQGTQNVYTPTNIDDMLTPSVSHNLCSSTPRANYDDDDYMGLLDDIVIPEYTSAPYTPMAPRTRHPTATDTVIDSDEKDILSHNISCGTQDINATPRMLQIIRSTSDGSSENDLA